MGSRLAARGFKNARTMKKTIIKIIVGEAVSTAVQMLLIEVINLIKSKRDEQKKKH